jgi:hypothetical protein
MPITPDQQPRIETTLAHISESVERCCQLTEANTQMQEQITVSRCAIEESRRLLAEVDERLCNIPSLPLIAPR